MKRARWSSQTDVFLNVPFDQRYEKLFVTLVCGLIAFGRVPRCVLQIPEHGQGRLERLIELMEQCPVSLHDLSRVGRPRFNMPFELGLACAIRRAGKHDFAVLEEVKYRVDRTLSDIKGWDVHIHGGKVSDAVNCIFNIFAGAKDNPDYQRVLQLVRQTSQRMAKYKRQRGLKTLFERAPFLELIRCSTELARAAGMIT